MSFLADIFGWDGKLTTSGSKSVLIGGGSIKYNNISIVMKGNNVYMTWPNGKKETFVTQLQHAEYEHETGKLFVDGKAVTGGGKSMDDASTEHQKPEIVPIDSETLQTLLDATQLHMRASVVMKHIELCQEQDVVSVTKLCFMHHRQDVVFGLAKHLGAKCRTPETWIAAIDECFIHKRADVVLSLISVVPALLNMFSRTQWSRVIDLIFIHKRADVMCAVIKKLPDAKIDESHIELCFVNSRAMVMKEYYHAQIEKAKRGVPKKSGLSLGPSAPESTQLSSPLTALASPVLVLEQHLASALTKEAKIKKNDADMELAMALSISDASANRKSAQSVPTIENPSKIKETPKSSSAEDECVVCLNGKKRHVLCLPCAHTPACMDCVNQLKKHECPLCQKPVTKWIVSS